MPRYPGIPCLYKIMTRPSKRKQLNREIAKEREKSHKARKIQEQRVWESCRTARSWLKKLGSS